jgi:hypothetical protein
MTTGYFLSIDDGAASRLSDLTPSNTCDIELIARLFPTLDELSEVRRITIDVDLLSESVSV